MKTLHVMTEAERALAPWLAWMADHPMAVFGGLVALWFVVSKLLAEVVL